MSFATLKFGEKCDRHPSIQPRGLDARTIIYRPAEYVKLGATQPQEPTWLTPSTKTDGVSGKPGASTLQAPRPTSAASGSATPVTAAGAKSVAPVVVVPAQLSPGPPLPPPPLPAKPLPAPLPPPLVLAKKSLAAPLATAAQSDLAAANLAAANVAAANLAAVSRRSSTQQPAIAAAVATATAPVHPKLEVELRRLDPAEAGRIFKEVDVNGNGMLSLAELDKAVSELWPNFNQKPVIMRAYKAADANASGFVSKKEFQLFLLYLQIFEFAWKTFECIDRNGDRRLSLAEFMEGAKHLSTFADKSAGELHSYFRQMDVNDGGFVLFDEFCHWFAEEAVAAERARLKLSSRRGKPRVRDPEVDHFLEMPHFSKISAVFSRLDFNNNGVLSLAELDKGVVELWPQFNNKPALMRAYKATDTDGDGHISRKEFRDFLEYLVVYANLWTRFTKMDQNGDRRITEDEFVSGSAYLGLDGLSLSGNDLRLLFRQIDHNRGGVLLFDEFCHYFASEAQKEYKAKMAAQKAAGLPEPAVLPLACHCCGSLVSFDGYQGHITACTEKLAAAISLLPSHQRRAVPAPPDIPRNTPDEVAKFNEEAKRIYQEEVLLPCPECRQVFKVAAFPAHFRTHRLTVLREKELRRDHAAALKAGPPPRPTHVDPAPPYDAAALCAAIKATAPEDVVRALHRQLSLHAVGSDTVTQRQLAKWLLDLRFDQPDALRLAVVFGNGKKALPVKAFQDALHLPPKPSALQLREAKDAAALEPKPQALVGSVGVNPDGVKILAKFVGGREEVFFVGCPGATASTLRRDVGSLKRRLQAAGYATADIQHVEIQE